MRVTGVHLRQGQDSVRLHWSDDFADRLFGALVRLERFGVVLSAWWVVWRRSGNALGSACLSEVPFAVEVLSRYVG